MDGLLSPDDMMLMDQGLLFDPRDIDAYTPTSDALALPETAAMMMPSSGVAEMLGYLPDPMGEGYLPSTADLIAEGDIEGLGYQLLGAAGDVMYAAAPLTGGLLAVPAASAKATRAAKLTKRQKDPMEYSSVTLDKPISEVEFEMTPRSLLTDRKVVSPDFFENKILLFGAGDRSAVGNLASLEGVKFDEPVEALGGRDYQLATPYGWASDYGVAKGILNRAKKAQAETGIEDVYLAHSTMHPQTIDFTEMNSSTVAKMLQEAPIVKRDAKEFDDMINELFDPEQFVGGKFVGVKSPKFAEWMSKQSGETRKAIVRLMDQAVRQKQGFPMIGKARYALTEEAQRDIPTFQTGLSFVPLDVAGGLITDPLISHGSYNTAIGRLGDPVQLSGTVDTSEVYVDLFDDLNKRVDKHGNPQTASMKQYTTRLENPYQVATPRVVDRLSNLLDY